MLETSYRSDSALRDVSFLNGERLLVKAGARVFSALYVYRSCLPEKFGEYESRALDSHRKCSWGPGLNSNKQVSPTPFLSGPLKLLWDDAAEPQTHAYRGPGPPRAPQLPGHCHKQESTRRRELGPQVFGTVGWFFLETML